MYLEKLKIKKFRNYNDLELDFDKNTILVIGDNGMGKTNLLESIYYISAGRSHRTNKSEELINWDNDFAVIRATVSEREEACKKNREKPVKHLIEVQLSRNNNISIRVDRVPYRKKSDFISILPSVIFSPDDLRIIKGSPTNRRDFLDSVIEKVQKDYQVLSIKYQKILNQRNSLLKSMVNANNTDRGNNLATWDEKLVKYGSEIMMKRLQFISEMQGIFSELMNSFFSGSKVKIFYVFSWERKKSSTLQGNFDHGDLHEVKTHGSMDTGYLKEKFSDVLKENLAADLNYRTTLVGPHRDDFTVLFNSKDMRSFGSQGQQRMSAICLRLCELELLKEKLNKKPVLLLDDVLSELDSEREQLLLGVIDKKYQTFITTASPGIFERVALDSIEKFSIEDNGVKKIF